MAVKKSELYSTLWASCDELRGGMDASQYKDYVLVMLFIKYVSDKYAGQPFPQITIPDGASFDDMVKLKGKMDIGDRINKEILGPLAEANQLSGTINVADFDSAEKLGSPKAKMETLTNLIAVFENPDLNFSSNKAEDDDILGDAYEFLMRHFATESGKSKGQFYTPAEVSRILAKVLQIPKKKQTGETKIYDPTCGSGSLLLKVAAETDNEASVYGQEKDVANAGLARMNMVLHNRADAVKNIRQGDTMSDPKFKDGNALKQFDYIVANPPFSSKNWSSGIEPTNDEFDRFELGLPPEKNGDYAFLLHIITSLKRKGKAAIILPHGVLFRGNAEEAIRKNLIKKGYIKGVIGLPANLFYGTGIPACIIIIDKENANTRKDIFLVDASKGFLKDGNKNRLREQDLHKIVDVFNNEEVIEKYSRKVPLKEIEDNEYNLNIPRYINTQEEEEDIQDLTAHLNGGIPLVDIDALNAYWEVYPTLRKSLFEKMSANYVNLKVDKAEIKETIFGHNEFEAYSKEFNTVLEVWEKETTKLLINQDKGSKPKELIATISEDLLNRFDDVALIDKYDVYQHLLDYWYETMQDDLYVIAAEGWEVGKVPGRKIKTTKAKGKVTKKDIQGIEGIESKLIPSELIVEKYFKAEYQAILDKEAKTEEVKTQMEELEEANNGDDGDAFENCRGGKGTITKGAIEACIKKYKENKDYVDELKLWNEYLDLFKEEAKIKKEAKEERKKLEKVIWEKYKTLSIDEIKEIVLNLKWLGTVKKAINSEMDAINQRLTGRIKEITERYEFTLGALDSSSKELEEKVSAHLENMGLVWS